MVEMNNIAKKLDALSESLIIERRKEGDQEPTFVISPSLLQEIKSYLIFVAGIGEKGSDPQDDSSKIMNLGIRLMSEGYPSIDSAGLLPTSHIIASMLVDIGYHHISKLIAHLENHLTIEQQLESTVMITFVERILEPDERIVYAEYGIVETKRLVSKIKRNGIILTNKRLLFVGCDIDTSRPSSIGPKYIMIHPAVRINISPNLSPTENHARFHYADVPHRSYFSSVDYVNLNQLGKIKIEKDGSLFLKASKDFQVQFSLSPANLNRPFVPVQEYRLANPQCDIYPRFYQNSADEDSIKTRLMRFKSELKETRQNMV